MWLSIPRGIVYHKISYDVIAMVTALYKNLDQDKVVQSWENIFARYIGTKYSLAFPFARTAIYYALKIQKLPKGSEILMPPITIKGILDVVLDLGLKPVFVDINLNTLCFDVQELEQNISSNTRAIIITYLFGIVPDVDEIVNLCRKHDVFIIEDFSQCLNGKYKNKKVGCFGDVGIYSASSIKTLDTYGGGLLVCDESSTYQSLKKTQLELHESSRIHLIEKIVTDYIRNVATSRVIFHLFVFPLLKIIAVLRPGSVMKHTGGRDQQMIKSFPKNWFEKYTTFQAKLGEELLPSVENSDLERKKNVLYLKSKINNSLFPEGAANTENVYWQLVAFFDNPIKAQMVMCKLGVDTSTTSLEMISSLNNYAYQGNTPNAAYLYKHGMFIPSYPGLSKEDLQYVADVVNEAIKQAN